jgi:hypothetical protein
VEGYGRIEMSRAKSIGSVLLGGWSGRRLLELLLLGAVLVCHGFFGASHQIHKTPNSDTLPVTGHVSHAGMQEADEGLFTGVHSDPGLDAMAYAAVLLALSLGAIPWLMGGARARIAVPGKPLAGGRFPRLVPHLARDPTPAVLQVFRL